MNHDAGEEVNQSGPPPRRGHAPGDPASTTDGHPQTGNVRGGDDQAGDPEGSRSEPVKRDIAAVEEIIEGEIDSSYPDQSDTVVTMTRSSWTGPIPAPADLADYERICSGAADRVLSMAERNLAIRETRESTIRAAIEGQTHIQGVLAEADRDALKRGQYLAAGVSALVAALSFAGMHITPWSAIGFAVPLAQVAAALIRTVTNSSGNHMHDGSRNEHDDQDTDDE